VAGNGLLIKLRERGATLTSHGTILYNGKKTGKSNYTDFVYDNGEEFEIAVNRQVCEELLKPKIRSAESAANQADDKPDPCLTGIIFKNVGPEEMLAQCDPDKQGCGP
jgi:hypothetical protein